MKTSDTVPAPTLIEWGVASFTLTGQNESGDRHVVKSFPSNILLGVVDGLGHGDEAAHAAKVAVSVLEQGSPEESLVTLMQRCHEALKGTRGAAMTLLLLNARDNMLTWLGVGNVAAVMLRLNAGAPPPRETMLLRGGVVGYQLPDLRTLALPITRGDTLIVATDGIRSGFEEGMKVTDGPVEPLATKIMAQHCLHTDDALVLVARYVGRAS